MNNRIKNLEGKIFGRLTVVKLDEERMNLQTGKKRTYWLCKCNCGNPNLISICSDRLKDGGTESCGCLHKEMLIKRNTKHNLSFDINHKNIRLHQIWRKMKQRCLNPNNPAYKNYGGRGISICNEWLNDFLKFYNWAISNDYNDNLTIERIDNNKNYEPTNCKWATTKEQANNRRSNILINYKNEILTLTQLCEKINIKYCNVSSYICRYRNNKNTNELILDYLKLIKKEIDINE